MDSSPDRRPGDEPKEPAEGSRETVDEALARSRGGRPPGERAADRPREPAKPQKDAEAGRPALDD